MATFAKLSHLNGDTVWVNLDRVERMERVPAWSGDRYSDFNDQGEEVVEFVGAKPERTRLFFSITADPNIDDDRIEVLETPDAILARLAGGAS